MNGSTLYQWPSTARFGRVVPKTKFYEHGIVTATLRERFVTEVQRITWAYKLADATVNLRGDASVPEIQVFVLAAKAKDVVDNVLEAIDKAVQFPIIFEIVSSDGEEPKTRMVAAHKQVGGTALRLSSYFSTEWLPVDAQRAPLPGALDLPGLYAALLAPLLPVARIPGEPLAETAARIDRVQKVEREVAALERKLRNEPQLNRKIEIRRQIRDRTATLTELTAPRRHTTDPLVKDYA